jgi:protein required for attachment to host cells
MKEMLDSASKTILMSTDPTVRSKHPNGLSGLQNLEIIDVEQGAEFRQVDTFPRNIQLFEKAVQDWQAHAQQTGSANDSIMGESPNSGTPFKLQELVTQENHSLHEYRKGKIATFLDTIYRDWIIPELVEDINRGSEFLADLELSELEEVCDKVITNEANKILIDKVLNCELIQEGEQEALMENLRQDFMKQGKKRFLKVVKNELNKSTLGVKTNIAGKQKYLAQHTEKLVNIVRQIIAAPQMMDDPRLSKMLNDIMESSGLSPIDFSQKPKGQPMQPQPTPSPIPQGNLETNNLSIV